MPENSKHWSILVATVFERSDYLVRLLDRLVPQVVANGDKVELLISGDDKQKPIGEKRQELMERSKGDYISFIDDDDLIPEDYVEKILPHLYYNDYIGFKLQVYMRGKPYKATVHSSRVAGVYEHDETYYRDISHLNPIRKEIAMLGKFDGGRNEDDRWADEVRKHKRLIKNERFIDEVMYYYYFEPERSL